MNFKTYFQKSLGVKPVLLAIILVFSFAMALPANAISPKVNGACAKSSDCGTDGFVGGPFCQGNKIYQNFKTFRCFGYGPNASCYNSTMPKRIQSCSVGQTCSNGSCCEQDGNGGGGSCNQNSDCNSITGYIGSPTCQNGNVWQNYATGICLNPGTSNSVCATTVVLKQKQLCVFGQTCNNGSCNGKNDSDNNGTCAKSSDCGTDGFLGEPFCQGNAVYKNFQKHSCFGYGSGSTCFSSIYPKQQYVCAPKTSCSNGGCPRLPI